MQEIRLKENLSIKKFHGASVPDALERKFINIPKETGWQYIFPARKPGIDPRYGKLKQHHRHESFLQIAVKKAVRKAQINKNASCHTPIAQASRLCSTRWSLIFHDLKFLATTSGK